MLQSGVTVAVALEDERFSDKNGNPLWSVAAGYRHRSRHLSATVLREVRANPELGAADLIDVLAETLGDVRAVRAAALAAGSSALLLRASDATLRAASALADRLGLDPNEVAREMRDSETVVNAISLMIRDHAETGDWLAEQLDQIPGGEESAAAARHLANASRARKEITK